jgi:hypothetical protein
MKNKRILAPPTSGKLETLCDTIGRGEEDDIAEDLS